MPAQLHVADVCSEERGGGGGTTRSLSQNLHAPCAPGETHPNCCKFFPTRVCLSGTRRAARNADADCNPPSKTNALSFSLSLSLSLCYRMSAAANDDADSKSDAKLGMLGLFQKASSPSRWRERARSSFVTEEDSGSKSELPQHAKHGRRAHPPAKPPPSAVPNPWKSPSWSTSGSAHLSATTLLIHEARAAVRQTASKLPSSPIKRRAGNAIGATPSERRYLGRPRIRPAVSSPMQQRWQQQHQHGDEDHAEQKKEQNQKESSDRATGKPTPAHYPAASDMPSPVLTVMTPGGIRLPRRRPSISLNPAAKELFVESDFLDHRDDETAAQIHRFYTPPRPQRLLQLLQDNLSYATSPLKSAAMPTRKGDVVPHRTTRARMDTPAPRSSQPRGGGSPSKSRFRGAIRQQVDSLRQGDLTALLEDPKTPLTYEDVRARLGLPSIAASVA